MSIESKYCPWETTNLAEGEVFWQANIDPNTTIFGWEEGWGDAILQGFQASIDPFQDVDPIIDTTGLGQSWSNMQEWANLSFQPPAPQGAAIEDIEWETMAMGGIRFGCYGTLPNVPIKLVGDMTRLREKIDFSTAFQSFQVTREADYFMLKFSEDELFAQINEHVSRGLAALDDVPSAEIIAFAETSRIQRVLDRAKRPGEATLKVEVNLYGSVDEAGVVGDKLSTAKLFLQDPDQGMKDIEYCNPHVIQFPGIEEPVPEIVETAIVEESSKASQTVREGVDTFDHTISTIYHSLTRFRNLERMQGGEHLLTPLLNHQETALFFMTQREFGPVAPEYSLWEYERHLLTPLYRHKLTGYEAAEPPNELGGGILADDMGMGKSFSTLALITSTLDVATSWSQEGASTSRKCRSKGTLIIVPSTLIMSSWFTEIKDRLDESIKVSKYYGKTRNLDMTEYLNSDIIFTTYHTVAASMDKNNSLIFGIEWFRVVLDEAHMIRRRETTLFRAATQLSARFRWCLTGTPIQNHLEDIGSLMAFLKVNQFENRAVFRNRIVVPFAEDAGAAAKNFAFLLDCICLRRTQELLHLPQIAERYQYVTLSKEERTQYNETLAMMAKYIREKAGRNPEKRDPFGIFQAQLQLRLICNHGTFQKPFTERHRRDKKVEREDFLYSLGKNAEITCSVCGIPIPVFDVLGDSKTYRHPCGHKLCQECIFQSRDEKEAQGEGEAFCPLCHAMVTSEPRSHHEESSPGIEDELEGYFNKTGISSKIDALLKDLTMNSSDTKSIVFSCWTRTLDLVSVYLRRNGILFQRIDGDQSLTQRRSNMDNFISDRTIPVLLMSTGVGAFGLNLTAANHVYILEPQWNPSVESQAIGRVCRLGQNKAVSVTRYLVRGTVEIVRVPLSMGFYDPIADFSGKKMHSQQIRKVELAKVGFQAADDTMADAT
ncbi:SNF2 family domain-containing protein isoform 2 [Cladophialophora immunda]|nr:SNF2 family domain-containing protein isoform 2 [Cladophialophora immunda]